MTVAQNPNGLLIDGLGLAGSLWTETLEHIVKANYSTVTVMDNFAFAIAVKVALPDCVVVYRSSAFSPQPGPNAVPQLRAFLSGIQSQDKRIVIMVSCENGFDQRYVDMWSDMIEAADPMGWKLCVGNVSSGSVFSGQGEDRNDWATTGARLLKTLYAHPGHYLGVHEYTSFFPWIVSNVGDWGTPDKPPTSINWKLNQWHIGRNAQGIVSAVAASKIGDLLNTKFMIITESLIDEMEQGVLARYPGVRTRGWKQLVSKWENEWFKGKSAEDTLADMRIWAWEKVYAPLGFVVGVHGFIYFSHDPQWDDFRLDTALQYKKRMEAYRYGVSTPVEPPAPPPAPEPDNTHVKILSLEQYAAIRAALSNALKLLG